MLSLPWTDLREGLCLVRAVSRTLSPAFVSSWSPALTPTYTILATASFSRWDVASTYCVDNTSTVSALFLYPNMWAPLKGELSLPAYGLRQHLHISMHHRQHPHISMHHGTCTHTHTHKSEVNEMLGVPHARLSLSPGQSRHHAGGLIHSVLLPRFSHGFMWVWK